MNATRIAPAEYLSMRCGTCDGVRWKGLLVRCFVCGRPGLRAGPVTIRHAHTWRAEGV